MMVQSLTAVRFISWNVQGCNEPVKRARIFNHLKHLRCDIAFPQETHILSRDRFRLKKGRLGHIFHSSIDSRSRGAAILVHEKIQFSATNVTLDPKGRFVIVRGLMYYKPVLMVNIYARNWDVNNFTGKLI